MNCGPRKLSGSSAEKSCATAPFGQVTCRFDGSKLGLASGGCTASKPGHALDHHGARVGETSRRPERCAAAAPRIGAMRGTMRAPIQPRPASCRRRARPASARSVQAAAALRGLRRQLIVARPDLEIVTQPLQLRRRSSREKLIQRSLLDLSLPRRSARSRRSSSAFWFTPLSVAASSFALFFWIRSSISTTLA